MPAFTYTGNYSSLSGWMWFTDRLDIADEGWKLHVSGNARFGQAILDRVLPVLQNGMVGHKFLATSEEVEALHGLQRGKMLAVYPDSIVQAFMVVTEIDRALVGVVGRHDVPCIVQEKWVGRTIVYTRYGAYNSSIYHPTRDIYVDDSIGETAPPWVSDPWGLYSANPDWRAVTAHQPWPRHSKEGHRRMGRK